MDDRRSRLPLPALATALLASLAVAVPSAQAADCPGADLIPVAGQAAAKAATLCLLNNERTARGLAPLTSQPVLERAATSYSALMVANRFFAHVTPTGVDIDVRLAPYTDAAGSSWKIGENLAWGEGALATPVSTVRAWMNSAGHRANILNGEFREIGIGIVNGSPRGSLQLSSATYTTEFGVRAGAAAGSRAAAEESIARAAATTPKKKAAAKRVSAKARKRIRSQCHRSVSKVRSTSKRRARYNRCVTRKLRAAKRG